ncbi:MAG: DUF3791 domain-containing protein [Butyricimonas faecihominis]
MSCRQAYRYLQRFKAISFVNTYYNIVHTLRMEDVVAYSSSFFFNSFEKKK